MLHVGILHLDFAYKCREGYTLLGKMPSRNSFIHPVPPALLVWVHIAISPSRCTRHSNFTLATVSCT